jgi:nucleotide-binding universal stress UspA family protein
MGFRKILAPLTGGSRDATVLASAFAAGEPFNAHIVGLFVRPDPAQVMPFFGEGLSGNVVQEIVDVAKAAADKAAQGAHMALTAAAGTAGVLVVDRPQAHEGGSASFHEVQGHFSDCVIQAARLADLVAFGPIDENHRPALTEAFDATLLETGRPVLLAAHAPSPTFAKRIAIAWDGGKASAHAVSAAMEYLMRAETIEILTVRQGTDEAMGVEDVREYLALYGLACTDHMAEAGQRPVGEVLLETATGRGASMLVLGGYGHSRLRQLFWGGVTRHVASHADIPLFLVH